MLYLYIRRLFLRLASYHMKGLIVQIILWIILTYFIVTCLAAAVSWWKTLTIIKNHNEWVKTQYDDSPYTVVINI
jgi:hypothetical protein